MARSTPAAGRWREPEGHGRGINNAKPYQLQLDQRGRDDLAYIFYNRTGPGSHADHCKIIVNLHTDVCFHVGPGWGGSL